LRAGGALSIETARMPKNRQFAVNEAADSGGQRNTLRIFWV
jgi:hypothetical protein